MDNEENPQEKLLNLYYEITPDLKREIYTSLSLRKRGDPDSDGAVTVAVWIDIVKCGFKYVLSRMPAYLLKKIGKELVCSKSKTKRGLCGDIVTHVTNAVTAGLGEKSLTVDPIHVLGTFGRLDRMTLHAMCENLPLGHLIPLDVHDVCRKLIKLVVVNGFEIFLLSLPLRILRKLCEGAGLGNCNLVSGKALPVYAFMTETKVEEAKKTYRKIKGEKRNEPPVYSLDQKRAKRRNLPHSFDTPFWEDEAEEEMGEFQYFTMNTLSGFV